MKLCKKSYREKGQLAVLQGVDLLYVVGGTNGGGLDPTDDKGKTKKEPALAIEKSIPEVKPIYKDNNSGG